MNPTEIQEILRRHALWLNGKDGGVRANLSGADLSRADPSEANLSGANLSGANLSRASLYGATLYRADLSGADLSGATLSPFTLCPDGPFRAYKNLRDGVIATLEIPEEARRLSTPVGRKCRAEYALVKALSSGTVGYARHDGTEYRVGEIVRPDSYDDDWRVECSHGIHFFITRKEAEGY